MMKLMLLTTDEKTICEAQEAGIDRIFLDLEYINKVERQMGRSGVISHNSLEDVARLRGLITRSEFLVRVNPIHANSKIEIEQVIAGGADIVMLPMVMDAQDAQLFVKMVGGRAKVCLLLETAQALARLDSILNVKGIDEIYIGLNDLHISMGLSFMFELLSGGIVEYMANKIQAKNIPFGFGGMAKIGEGELPAECILAEHYRLGSSSVILSRVFRNETVNQDKKVDLVKEIQKIRDCENIFSKAENSFFDDNRRKVRKYVEKICQKQ